MQTTAIRTVANSLPEKGVILLTLLISDRYILFAELQYFVGILGRCGGFLCLFNMKSVIGKCFVIRKTHISSFLGVRIC